MKKSIYRYVTLLIISLCIFSAAVPKAIAADDTAQPRYELIRYFYAELVISDSGYAKSSCGVRLRDPSGTVSLTMELQQSGNGTTWSTIKSWDASGVGSATLEKGWYVLSGYSYRVKATADVYSASGGWVETEITYSSIVYY